MRIGIKMGRLANAFKSTLFSQILQILCKYNVAIMKSVVYIKGKALAIFSKQVL